LDRDRRRERGRGREEGREAGREREKGGRREGPGHCRQRWRRSAAPAAWHASCTRHARSCRSWGRWTPCSMACCRTAVCHGVPREVSSVPRGVALASLCTCLSQHLPLSALAFLPAFLSPRTFLLPILPPNSSLPVFSVFTTSVFTTSVFTTSVFTTSVFTTSVFTTYYLLIPHSLYFPLSLDTLTFPLLLHSCPKTLLFPYTCPKTLLFPYTYLSPLNPFSFLIHSSLP
jgi:hypothetical protein